MMAMPKKVLVAYDGSPQSKTALGWAMLLGGGASAEMDVIKVFEAMDQRNNKLDHDFFAKVSQRYTELKEEDRQMLEDVLFYCKEAGKPRVRADLLTGNVASTLLDYARQREVDLIVTGTKGHGALAEMLVGSVTNSLVSLSKIPVLAVKERKAPGRLREIVVAFDGSPCAEAALQRALDIAGEARAEVSVVKVADPMNFMMVYQLPGADGGLPLGVQKKLDELEKGERAVLQKARDIGTRRGVAVKTKLLAGGNFADSLIREAEESQADMIVAGTLGHSRLGGLLLGSVTRNLISLAPMPVLVVKQ